jgi:hypothetical protein
MPNHEPIPRLFSVKLSVTKEEIDIELPPGLSDDGMIERACRAIAPQFLKAEYMEIPHTPLDQAERADPVEMEALKTMTDEETDAHIGAKIGVSEQQPEENE